MSDIHTLPLMGHDMAFKPLVRGKVYRAGRYWYWSYYAEDWGGKGPLNHGPFSTWREAYDSAWRMVEAL